MNCMHQIIDFMIARNFSIFWYLFVSFNFLLLFLNNILKKNNKSEENKKLFSKKINSLSYDTDFN